MFKRFIKATLAAVAVTALAASAPAAAQTGTAGDLSMGIGWLSIHGVPPSTTLVNFTGVGRGNVALGMNWNLEAQAGVRSLFISQAGGKQGVPALADGYLHLWGRHPSAAFGIFGGVQSSYPGYLFSSIGGEIKGYGPRSSFGAAAAATFLTASAQSFTLWTVNAHKNFFINPNIRLGLRASVVTGLSSVGSGIRDNVWEAAFDYEQRLPTAPLSLWVSVTRVVGIASAYDSWRTEGGIRFFMDAPRSSLQSHDKDVPFTFSTPSLIPF